MRSKTFSFGCAVAALLLAFHLSGASRETAAQEPASKGKLIAPTPPMGWNSWDSYGLRINEQQFRENVAVLAMKLKSFGYNYAVIDEGWYMHNPENRPKPELLKYAVDENGRFIPVTARFPSALQNGKNTGFLEVANLVHSKGLKFGIHIVRGIPRESVQRNLPIEGSSFTAQDAADQNDPCPWDPTTWGVKDTPAGQAWYDSLLRQYAMWGVDFLKVDCIADHPYKPAEIRQINRAIGRSGREMVLSLSPGPTAVEHHAEIAEVGQMWRISNDVWDFWIGQADYPTGVQNQFERAARWAQYAKPGAWPDADMLPVGELRPYPDVGPAPRHTRLTPAEQHTLLSLWAMARSPLIVGANLTLLDKETLGLLCNRDILKIDQTATASREVLHEGDLVVWSAALPGDEHALALFNLGEKDLLIDRPLTAFVPAGDYDRKNAWTNKKMPVSNRVTTTLQPHSSMVLLLKKK